MAENFFVQLAGNSSAGKDYFVGVPGNSAALATRKPVTIKTRPDNDPSRRVVQSRSIFV